MNFAYFQNLIGRILCDIKELKETIVKKIAILFNNVEVTDDVSSINFTGNVEVTNTGFDVTVDVKGGLAVLEDAVSVDTEVTSLDYKSMYVEVVDPNTLSVKDKLDSSKQTYAATTISNYIWNVEENPALFLTGTVPLHTVTIANYVPGNVYMIYIQQSGAGGNDVTFTNTPIQTVGSIDLTANAVTLGVAIILPSGTVEVRYDV